MDESAPSVLKLLRELQEKHEGIFCLGPSLRGTFETPPRFFWYVFDMTAYHGEFYWSAAIAKAETALQAVQKAIDILSNKPGATT